MALLGLLLLAVCPATGCRTAATRQVSGLGPAVARLQAGGSLHPEVDRLVQPLLARGQAFGMVVGVVTPDGATQTFCYGRSGRPGEAGPPGPDSLFQIGSVSKLFVEALLARLVQEGQLHYEDTVAAILPPDLRVSTEVGRLTLYELATHTGGLPREPFTVRQLWSFARYLVTGRNLYSHLSRRYLYAYLRHCHIKPAKRGQFAYSNIGIGLLAHLIEIKTGRPATDLIVEKVCRPLGMSDSAYVLDASRRQRLMVGHTGNQACWKPRHSPLAPWDMGDLMRPSAGLYSSAHDLLAFARANLGLTHNPLESALASTHQVQAETPRGGQALGWLVNRFDQERVTITFKDGVLAGYSAYLGLNLQKRLAVVVLQNQFTWDDKVGLNLLLRLSAVYPSPASRLDALNQKRLQIGADTAKSINDAVLTLRTNKQANHWIQTR